MKAMPKKLENHLKSEFTFFYSMINPGRVVCVVWTNSLGAALFMFFAKQFIISRYCYAENVNEM